MNKLYVVSFTILMSLFLVMTEAKAQHKGISFQAVIKKPDGSYPTVSGMTVTVQILDPVNNCVLREEEHTGKNVSNGYINLVVGDPNASTLPGKNPSPVLSIAEVMNNKATRTGLKCVDSQNNIVATNQSYIPSNVDRRVLRLRMNIQGEDVAADFNMRAVGFAVNSEMLNSKSDTDFINVNVSNGVDQNSLESIFQRYTKLDAILNGFNSGGTTAGINITGNASTATTATNVSGIVALANGGTGASDAAGARVNLGLGSLAVMSPSGAANNTTYLRGDGTWAALPAGGSTVTSVAGRDGDVTLSATDISGLGPVATMSPSGTANGTTYLRGDGAWAALGTAASLNIGTGPGTVAAGNDSRITKAIQNIGMDNSSNIISISAGLDSNKPASPVAGQMYVATDEQKIYRYDGSIWVTVAQAGSGFSGSLAGDVTGSQSSTSVEKIKGMAVTNAGVGDGKFLRYNSGTWAAALIGLTDITGLGDLAAKNSVNLASSDVTGTLAAARMPALSGDVTSSAGSASTTISSGAVNALSKVVASPGSSGPNRLLATDTGTGTTIMDFYCTTVGHVLKWTGTTGFGCSALASSDISGFNTDVDARITAQKGAANGIATLDGNTRVPASQLGIGMADNATYLRGDGSWQQLPANGISTAVNISTASYGIQATDSGKGFYYTHDDNGSISLPALSAVSNGFTVLISREVKRNLTIAPNGSDKFVGGRSSLEMKAGNLQNITLMKLGATWKVVNQSEECVVGQECWTADNTGGMKQIYAGTYRGYQYFTTPGGCTDSANPVCAGGMDTVLKSWATASPEVDAQISPSSPMTFYDGKAGSALIASYATAEAAQYCENMNYAGYTDWYLPAPLEMITILMKKQDLLGGFEYDGINPFYWTMMDNTTIVYVGHFLDNSLNSYSKGMQELKVRCVRRSE